MSGRKRGKSSEEREDSYIQKRQRNNEAVNRTRAKKRLEEAETTKKVEQLRTENEQLERQVDSLQKELKFLKEMFIAYAKGKRKNSDADAEPQASTSSAPLPMPINNAPQMDMPSTSHMIPSTSLGPQMQPLQSAQSQQPQYYQQMNMPPQSHSYHPNHHYPHHVQR